MIGRRCIPPDRTSASSANRIDLGELIAECAANGQLEELREALALHASHRDSGQIVRDLLYELAAASDRDLAVDALIHATGIADFECRSLRDYARKHGLTPEGFRIHVRDLRRRLNLTDHVVSFAHHGI